MEYAINNPGAQCWYVHVRQIKNYLAFDKTIREGNNISNFPGIPLGYIDFAIAFNTGTLPNDMCCVSTYLPSSTGDHVIASDCPVYLEDFHITPEQCGLPPPRRPGITEAQSLIFEDYANNQALKIATSVSTFKSAKASVMLYLADSGLLNPRSIGSIH